MNVDIDISDVVLKTERLTLRPWRPDDLDDFYEYASVDGVGQMAGWMPHRNKEESLEVLRRFIGKKRTFALEYEGKVIGSLGIEEYNEDEFPEFAEKRCRELGYVLSKAYWGRGLMPEAVRRVMEYLFDEVKLDVIFCGHFVTNIQSARVQEKCGFRHYGFIKYKTSMGTTEDCELNLIRREEFTR